jgi:SlyX protein
VCKPAQVVFLLPTGFGILGLCRGCVKWPASARPAGKEYRSQLVSNSAMEHLQHIDQRLTDLEIKASFAEDMVEQLNQIIIRQQKQIDQLVGEVLHLREQSEQAAAGGPRNMRDDLPPHF